MRMLAALAVALWSFPAGAAPLAGPAAVDAPLTLVAGGRCDRCGCRGGPGWRIIRTGQCASKKNLAKACGSPPSPARCTKEN